MSSIDEGDKWLNEFKIRREAIVNSPVKKVRSCLGAK